MSLESFMLQALQNATEADRADGILRPTFVIPSAEGVYQLVCPTEQFLHSDDDASLHVVSALLRWSMTRAFVVACAYDGPCSVAVYAVTVDGVQGFSIRRHRRRLQLGSIRMAVAPSYIRRLSALIPDPESDLSQEDLMELEDVFGVELEDCRPYYLN
jgi:hypothetical protein